MNAGIFGLYNRSALATKIRYSYLLLLVPIVTFLIFCFVNMWTSNQKYEDMINSTVVASEFSLDFKKDFDYETYLVIVGNKTIDYGIVEDFVFNIEEKYKVKIKAIGFKIGRAHV